MTQLNEVNRKLGELLIFISDIAVSARMNTSYNPRAVENKDSPKAAMWLVDMLHNFGPIGTAIAENKPDVAIQELARLRNVWSSNESEVKKSLSVNQHGHCWSVEQGLAILVDIEKLLTPQCQ